MSTSTPTLMPDEESHLLEQLRAGGQAFETLVRTYSAPMLASVRRLLGRDEEARAAVRDAFLSVLQSLDRFEEQCRLGIWLQRMVIHSVLSKQSKVERPLEELLPKFSDDGCQIQPAQRRRESSQTLSRSLNMRELVRQKLAQLPEAYRVVLWLRDIDGLDLEATAQVLDLNAALVKTRLHRARQALTGLLDAQRQGGGVS